MNTCAVQVPTQHLEVIARLNWPARYPIDIETASVSLDRQFYLSPEVGLREARPEQWQPQVGFNKYGLDRNLCRIKYPENFHHPDIREALVTRLVTLLAVILVLSMIPETDAHDYDEVKEGRWSAGNSPQCEGYNLHLYRIHVEQSTDNQSDEYRFSQYGHRVIVTGLKSGSQRITVLGEVSEEYMHFEILESTARATVLSVSSVEILDDEEELEYTTWITAHYADPVLIHCTGIWIGSTCSGDEYITGVPNFSEGYKRFSVKCAGTLEWVGD